MRRLKFLLKILLAVMLLTAGVEAEEAPAPVKVSTWQPELRVGILSGVQSVEIEMSAPSVITDGEDAKKILDNVASGEKIPFDAGKIKADAVE